MIFESLPALRQHISEVTHREYYTTALFWIIQLFIRSVEGISFLHQVVGKGRHSLHNINIDSSE